MTVFSKNSDIIDCKAEETIRNSIPFLQNCIVKYQNLQYWWPNAYMTSDYKHFVEYVDNGEKESPCQFVFHIDKKNSNVILGEFLYRTEKQTFAGKYQILFFTKDQVTSKIIWELNLIIKQKNRLGIGLDAFKKYIENNKVYSSIESFDNLSDERLQQIITSELKESLTKLRYFCENIEK